MRMRGFGSGSYRLRCSFDAPCAELARCSLVAPCAVLAGVLLLRCCSNSERVPPPRIRALSPAPAPMPARSPQYILYGLPSRFVLFDSIASLAERLSSIVPLNNGVGNPVGDLVSATLLAPRRYASLSPCPALVLTHMTGVGAMEGRSNVSPTLYVENLAYCVWMPP